MHPLAFTFWVIVLIAAAKAQSAPMQTNTSATTSSGVRFTIPKWWSVDRVRARIVLRPPEADTRVAILDVGAAQDAPAAAAAAWALYRPEAPHQVTLATSRDARNGWDEQVRLEYEHVPSEHTEVFAIAYRSGAHWTVVIQDGSEGTVEKRLAAVNLIFDGVRAAGYQRESFAKRSPHSLDAARIATLKSFVESSMAKLGIPGTAMAFIDHGRVVFEGGLGVRELGKPDPVDAHTLYMIASNTKGLSTLLLARLVDSGKVAWDEPVTQVYPSFRLGNAVTTRKVRIRDLVCACTGLPRSDFEWILNTPPDTPASATFRQLAVTEPTTGFGEVFQYNNLMASAAGYIAGHLVHPTQELGLAYDAAMQEGVFDPLGMHDTTFDMTRALRGDHASPHGDDINGKPTATNIAMDTAIVPYRPAGGAWSSADDLIKYVQNEITEGVLPDGRRWVSAKNLLMRRAPSVPVGEDRDYGMGLINDRSSGVTVVHHGGSLAGFQSDIVLIPSARVGAVILTNSDDGEYLLGPFTRRLLEVLYDGKLEAEGNVTAAAMRNQAEIVNANINLY